MWYTLKTSVTPTRMTLSSSPSRLQLAVFDLDGTLVHLEHEHYATRIHETFQRLSLPTPPVSEILDKINNHALKTLFESHDQEEAFWRSYDDGEIPTVRAFTRSLHALEGSIERGLHVAIATARRDHHEVLQERLRHTGILRHVRLLSTFHQTGWKNKVEQLRVVCRHFGVEPQASMMVGDSQDDMKSSRALGFGLRLAIDNKLPWRALVLAEEPDRMLHCVGEVPSAIDDHHERQLS